MVVSPISGFMPIPLALMIPFMATQSLVMGEAFGKGFQYGKRRISAMSNEEFNKYTPSMMADDMFKSYTQIIPQLKTSISQSTDLQNYIVSKLIDMPRELIVAWANALAGKTTESTYQPEPEKFIPPIPGTSGEPEPEQVPTSTKPSPTTEIQKYFIHNFQITIKYTIENKQVAPNDATVQSTAFKWFRLSHPDTVHQPIKYFYGKQNYSGYWRYSGDLQISSPVGDTHLK